MSTSRDHGYFLPGFRASLRVEPGNKEAERMVVGSGQKLCALLTKPGPLGSCLKTLLESETWGSTEYCLKWKLSVTKSGLSIFRLVPLTRRNSGTGCGLWGTPRKTRGGYCTNMNNPGNPILILEGQVKATWPTPQNRDGDQRGQQIKRFINPRRSNDLPDLVSGTNTAGSNAQTVSFVVRLMNLSAWLMGYTVAYLEHWGTVSSRKSRRKSSVR